MRLLILIAAGASASAGRLASRNYSGVGADASRRGRSAVPAARDEQAIEDGLVRAEEAVTACAAQSTACRQSARALIEACAGIVSDGRSSAELRHRALTALGKVAGDGNVDPSDLPRVVWVCEHAAGQRDIRCLHYLEALNSVALSKFSDMATLEAIVSVAVQLIEDIDFEDGREEFPGDVLKAMSVVSRFSHRVVSDVRTCKKVVQAVGLLIERTRAHSARFVMARSLAMHVLSRQIVPLTTSKEVFAEVLGVVESALSGRRDDGIVRSSLHMVSKLASGVEAADLARVVGVLEKLGETARPERALSTVATRLLQDEYDGPTQERLELVARTFAVFESLGVRPPCSRAVHFLSDVETPEPPSQAALRGIALLGLAPALSPELLMYIDDYVPPFPEDVARSRIVSVCARSARRDLRSSRLVLHASCLLPRRIGLRAARAFAAIAREAGGARLGRVVRPVDFALVGECLQDTLMHWAGPGSPDAAMARGVASELLAVASGIADAAWDPSERQGALEALCGLTWAAHPVCWTDEVLAGSSRTRDRSRRLKIA